MESHIRTTGWEGNTLGGSIQELKIHLTKIQARFLAPERRDTCVEPAPGLLHLPEAFCTPYLTVLLFCSGAENPAWISVPSCPKGLAERTVSLRMSALFCTLKGAITMGCRFEVCFCPLMSVFLYMWKGTSWKGWRNRA